VLFYYMWKYLFLWQLEQPRSGETGGLFFPKAINHVFVGMYLQQLCLAALFFLATNENKKHTSVAEGALMVVLIAFTAFFHLILSNSYSPLIEYLPLTLADSAHGQPDENRDAAERELNDQASVRSVNLAVEKRASSQTRRRSRVNSAVTADASDAPLPPAQTADTERGRAENVAVPQGKDVRDSSPESDLAIDEEAGPKDFYHPASVEPQRVIWLPRDPLGLALEEAQAIRDAGIAVSIEDAVMDDKGHVDIQGAPPDVKAAA